MKNSIAFLFLCLFSNYVIADNYSEKLLDAARRKSEDGIYFWVACGAYVNYKDWGGMTALMELAKGTILPEEREKVERAVRYLINKGANPYLLNRFDWESVFDIAKLNYNDFISYTILDQLKQNLLKAASELNFLDLISIVDNQDADVNCRDKYGNTPLIVAINSAGSEKMLQNKLLSIVNFLIEREANPNLINWQADMNAFDCAEYFGQKTVIKILERNGLHEIVIIS